MAHRAGLGVGARPPLDVLVRLNPDVVPDTIAELAVGEGASKFGLTETEATALVEWLASHGDGALRPRGIHLHVGSQLRAVDAWRDAVRRGLAVVGLLRGGLAAFDTLDVGGGFPVMPLGESAPDPERFAREVPALLAALPEDRRPTRLAIEPGRALVARAGWLVASVLHVRERGGRQVVIDAGMTELIRPALYGARHPIVALTSLGRSIAPDEPAALEPARVEGPICESTDALGIHDLPPLRRGDLVAISDAGAYARVAGVDLQRPAACPAGPGRHGRSACGASAAHGRDQGLRMDDMTRHRSAIVVLATLVWLFAISAGVASAASPAPSAPPPGPPFPAPEVDRAVYDYAGILSPEAIAAAEATIDGIEARTGSEVVVYTQDSGDLPVDRGDRGKGARADGPVGGRSQGLQRRAGHLLRHAAEPRARPGPAVRRPGLRGGLPVERGAPGDLPERHAALARGRRFRRRPRSRAREGRRRGDARARRRPPALPPDQRGRRSGRRLDGVPGADGLGPLQLAPLRQGPRLSRRSVGPDARPTAGPDRGIGRDDHGWRDVAARAHDGHARPRVAWLHRVPGSAGRAVRGPQGRGRCRAGRRRCRDGGPTPAQPATSDGPGGAGRARPATGAGRRR